MEQQTDLKGFYPKGIKDELEYYAGQFNSIELNATFYNMPTADQVTKWKEKTPKGFKFFPKLTNSISHFKRLTPDSLPVAETFCNAVANFEEKLGMAFLQLHDKFSPKEFEKLAHFIEHFPRVFPLQLRSGMRTGLPILCIGRLSATCCRKRKWRILL
ncbi:DUF72 domain-containing protein [Niabella sp. W65]|nr:DUF72 domain-containing protein [Niabella sp. W65]MCH7368742.1 DUF72 domain-containing protein [Niabella sp. W65]